MTDERLFAAGQRVDDLDLSGVHLHGVSLEGARITDADLVGADISGYITGLRINGVDIEPFVEAELDRRFPERMTLRATDVDGLLDGWSMVERLWAETTQRAAGLSPELLTRRVDGEWSYLETLRHLIFATDCWLFRGIRLVRHPYHPWGIPWGTVGFGSAWAEEVGVDLLATPDLAELLPVRQAHQQAVRAELEQLTNQQLTEVRTAPDDAGHPTGEHSVLHCLHVILNEEWEHHRYAVRDLTVLEG